MTLTPIILNLAAGSIWLIAAVFFAKAGNVWGAFLSMLVVLAEMMEVLK